MTAERGRPPQDTLSSNIIDPTKVWAATNHDINQCKAMMSRFKFNFDKFNFTQSYVMPVYRCRWTVPQDVEIRRGAPQDTAYCRPSNCCCGVLRR